MTEWNVAKATSTQREAAIATLVLAFSSDPAARWLYPEPDQYLCHFPDFVRAFAGRAFDHDTAYCVDNVSGAALWMPPGAHPDEDATLALLQQTVAAKDQTVVLRVFEQMNYYHPKEPHWYLPMIGVDPSHHNRGLGSALLTHILQRCDKAKRLAYLESSNPKNIPLYQRHGFRLLATIQAGDSAPLFPMVRQPH